MKKLLCLNYEFYIVVPLMKLFYYQKELYIAQLVRLSRDYNSIRSIFKVCDNFSIVFFLSHFPRTLIAPRHNFFPIIKMRSKKKSIQNSLIVLFRTTQRKERKKRKKPMNWMSSSQSYGKLFFFSFSVKTPFTAFFYCVKMGRKTTSFFADMRLSYNKKMDGYFIHDSVNMKILVNIDVNNWLIHVNFQWGYLKSLIVSHFEGYLKG